MWGQPTTERGRMPVPDDADTRPPRRPHRRRRVDRAAGSAPRVLGRGLLHLHAPRDGQGHGGTPARVRDLRRSRLGLAAARTAGPRPAAAGRRPRQLQRDAGGRGSHRPQRAHGRARGQRHRDRVHVPRHRDPRPRRRTGDHPAAAPTRQRRGPRRAGRAHGAAPPAPPRGGAGHHQRPFAGRDRGGQGGHRAEHPPLLAPRASQPFVAINCAAIPEALLESELFGHERGAFTGAVREKTGLLETATEGTLLLDEVGEMPLPAQAEVAPRHRAAADRARRRRPPARPVDVRFVAATNRDLEQLHRRALSCSGGISFFRLRNGVSVSIPPLRERFGEPSRVWRGGSSSSSARPWASRASRSSRTALEQLRAHSWPGNVRELRNVIERAVLLCESAEVAPRHLVRSCRSAPPR